MCTTRLLSSPTQSRNKPIERRETPRLQVANGNETPVSKNGNGRRQKSETTLHMVRRDPHIAMHIDVILVPPCCDTSKVRFCLCLCWTLDVSLRKQALMAARHVRSVCSHLQLDLRNGCSVSLSALLTQPTYSRKAIKWLPFTLSPPCRI